MQAVRTLRVVSAKKVKKSQKGSRVRRKRVVTILNCSNCSTSSKVVMAANVEMQMIKQDMLNLQNEKCALQQKIAEMENEVIPTKQDGKTYADVKSVRSYIIVKVVMWRLTN